MPPTRLHLGLLGTFRLRQGDQPVAGFEHAYRLEAFKDVSLVDAFCGFPDTRI